MVKLGNKRALFSAIATALLALVLLFMSWPRLQAAWLFLPVEAALSRYFSGHGVDAVQYGPLIERARKAQQTHADYRYLDGLSLLYYLRAIDETSYPWQRRPALHQASEAGLAAVKRNPVQPGTWLRIAHAGAALGTPDAEVVAALEMSILTGRVEPTLLMQRLILAYAYLPMLDPEMRGLLRDQTELAWRLQPRMLSRALAEGRLDAAQVKSVVGDMSPIFLQPERERS